jgi:hypothetical protein
VLGVRLQPLGVRDAGELKRASDAAVREKADALLVVRDTILQTLARQITDFAARHRLPAIYGGLLLVEAGALISYGSNVTTCFAESVATWTRSSRGRASRSSHRATHQVRAGDRPQNCQGARFGHTAVATAGPRPGHRVTSAGVLAEAARRPRARTAHNIEVMMRHCRAGLHVVAILVLTGCSRLASVPPDAWRMLAAVLLTVVSCWLTHRIVDHYWRTPDADEPPIDTRLLPRSPWYLPPFDWEWTLASSLSIFKFTVGVGWLIAWLWFFLDS